MSRAEKLKRRTFIGVGTLMMSTVAFGAITGFGFMRKKNIRDFGKTFTYLKDPAFRKKETGTAMLTVDGAEFSGERFDDMDWHDIVFRNCDFVGGYDIGPSTMENVVLGDCNFSGVLSFGVTNRVRFLRCNWTGRPVMFAEKGSKNTVFQGCQFNGSESDTNNWGAVGSYGESEFLRCKAKWFNLRGHAKLSIGECEFQDVDCATDERNSGIPSVVSITKSKLRGAFGMVAADLQSLTIRDTVLDNLDLTNATVKGDVLIERVRGGSINAGVKIARNFTVSNSEIVGNGQGPSFVMAMDSAQHVVLEETNFGTSLTLGVNLGPGRPLHASEWSPVPTNKRALIRNCTLPVVNASWLETQHLQIEGNTIGSLNVSNGRIGKLEVSGNAITRAVDFTNTQVKESHVQAIAKGLAKLDGSNVKVN